LMGSREFRIGSSVLGYKVEALIGRGGMGVVYRVFDPALDRRVALKLIAPELALDEAFRERFLQESRAVAALEHPSVVPVYSAGQLEDTLYLAMRYVEGSDLRALLAGGPLPPERAIDICAQVAAALDAAHERGLVHRDVKPSNILVGDGDHVYLGDFGLSRRLDAYGPAPGTLLGTIAYVAPEQIRGDGVDGRADCYSLACVLYECLSGEPPFAGRSDVAVLFAHLEVEPPTLPDLGAVFATGLAKDPEDRYGSCSELIDAARRALGLQPRRRRWPLVALAAAVIVTVAVGVGAVVRGHGGSQAGGTTGRIAAIDASSGTVGNAIPIGGQPGGIAVGRGEVWATTEGNALWKIDASRRDATPITTRGPPTNVALAVGSVWVGEGDPSGVQRFDGKTGELLRFSKTAGDPPFVSSNADLVWASGPDEVCRITPDTGQAAAKCSPKIPNPPQHRLNELRGRWSINGLSAGPDGVWVVGDELDQHMWRVDRRRPRAVNLGFPPSGVADGYHSLWVTDQLGHRLVRIDPATGHITAIIRVGNEPMAVVVAPSGVWVANAVDGTVSRIDPRRDKVRLKVPVGFSPTALAVDGNRIWVAGDAS
jgi:DNA-binding beta-propeller fold protein YncE